MNTLACLIVAATAALSRPVAAASTNAVAEAVSATNAPSARTCRRQCEAVTKSGNRCKRNAAPGAGLCRQHQRIADSERAKRR